MNQILDKIMSKLISGGFVKSEDTEIVRFGLELTIMKTIISAAMLIVAFALHSAPAVIFFMAVYQPLRSCCGGYHARTRCLCFFSSMMILLSVIAAEKLLTDTLGLISSLFFIISGLVLIFIFAPTDTPTKPFDNIERIVFRKRSLIAAFFSVIAADVFMFFGFCSLLISASMAIFYTGLLLIIGRSLNKKGAIA
ncbi:MAG: accessory gene regulator B family protein [Ruminococcus sp.]|uniref:accessory gene regulator ArgB-like protein n=1 Tax=Ruminococcus sp. TaxID=41978 RepID=UPI0025D4FE2E|nr:accessory gene regulator B family protein [Ruminococcus sp.]MCR5599834.1 accessory gene regulator B family protein [Ruminococcus sp.]